MIKINVLKGNHMIAIILAAGYATRLYPLTLNTPKPLLPLGEQLIIDIIVEKLDHLPDLNSIVVISNDRFFEQFYRWAEALDRTNKTPILVMNDGTTNESNKRGAIGDIEFVIKELDIKEDVCILAGDNIFTYDLCKMYEFFKKKDAPTLVAIDVPDKEEIKQLAVATIGSDDKVIAMEEKPSNPKSTWAIYATYFYRKEDLHYIEDYLLEGNSPDAPGYFPSWLYRVIPVFAYRGVGTCIDIGTIENYRKTFDQYSNQQ